LIDYKQYLTTAKNAPEIVIVMNSNSILVKTI